MLLRALQRIPKKVRALMGEAKRKKETLEEERATKGIYTEYLDRKITDIKELNAERKRQLDRIATIRGRDILVYAADLTKGQIPNISNSIGFDDLMPFRDQVSVLTGDAVDVILETPGGLAEVAEDMVDILRHRFESVAFIVPGWAKSAGTIMVMSGDEILMEPASSLGPIDAQLQWRGKLFSAEAFLDGLETIKDEAKEQLNKAYIPILQQISPGEIQNARNALVQRPGSSGTYPRGVVSCWHGCVRVARGSSEA